MSSKQPEEKLGWARVSISNLRPSAYKTPAPDNVMQSSSVAVELALQMQLAQAKFCANPAKGNVKPTNQLVLHWFKSKLPKDLGWKVGFDNGRVMSQTKLAIQPGKFGGCRWLYNHFKRE
ncbi:hypothetical protein B0H16DRAFT_1466235 [Mycena metata]|uniref:Uncharacterized protein n=1 Tax=Mycena metata TaxID=1033252 RepID=A0AAD7MXV1_9AGAR|nr:hypothetical protein B0H16DRAFT_1466235 [Mycena metata]